MNRIDQIIARDEAVLTTEDIKVLDRHYDQVFGRTAFLHTSAKPTGA